MNNKIQETKSMNEYENMALNEPEDDSTPARLDELGEGGELPEETAAA